MTLPARINRVTALLASPHILFFAMPWMMVVLVLGTVMQPSLGLFDAVHRFIVTWFIWVWGVPLPFGGLTVMAIITINLLAKYAFKSEWYWHKVGIHITHAGVLVLLLSGVMTAAVSREGYMVVPEGKTSAQIYAFNKDQLDITPPARPGDAMRWGTPMEQLPFTLTLTDFVQDHYAGTMMPKSYHADLIVTQNGQSYPVRIAMNDPLRLNGYTLYQSSFIDVGDKQATILQVTHNRGRLFPYLATMMITIGLIVHLLIVRKERT